MRLSIVIVNYNVRYFLEQAILSVQKAIEGFAAEIIVVDNHSADGSLEMLKTRFPEVVLIANSENTGFSKANNQGIQIAKGEYVLLLNPDTIVEEDTFKKCLAFMDTHPDAGAVGVRMIDGAGKYLPESKRGFPSPWVAFCKISGLSYFFPGSRAFSGYYLGHLPQDQTNQIDILSGAFMFMRRTALDKAGWLDEDFFMYGEDIDLSYRISRSGFKVYYLPETNIVHYKGESTKRGSLNYVKVFYQAMIIFAHKHFTGEKARIYIFFLNCAIVLRALFAILYRAVVTMLLPIFEILISGIALYYIKIWWASEYFNNPQYYSYLFDRINLPLYIGTWMLSLYLSGAYYDRFNIMRILRAMVWGTIGIAAVYGFLDPEYRNSRMLILLGAFSTTFLVICNRLLIHFIKYKNLRLGKTDAKNLLIVGGPEESTRILNIIKETVGKTNYIGRISATPEKDSGTDQHYLTSLDRLKDVVSIYHVNEIIFCAQDISAHQIMHWMSALGANVEIKIAPPESLSIIGSHSKNMRGELYTYDISYNIASPLSVRNKRILDILFSILCLLLFPLFFFITGFGLRFITNAWQVLTGKKTWIGYIETTKEDMAELPRLKKGVLTPLSGTKKIQYTTRILNQVNFLYARNYRVWQDLSILLRSLSRIGDL